MAAPPGGQAARGASSGGVAEFLELALVDGLLEGLFAGDLLRVEELLDRRVHGAHAESTARLHGVLELIELALADEVGGRRGVHQDLERHDAARLVGPLQQLLRNDAASEVESI